MQAGRITVHGAQHTLIGVARIMAAAAVAGGLTGLLVGGLVGRLVMRLLAVTSPVAQGAITDDNAVVGVVSLGGSVALALFCVQAGALGGLVLLLARRVLGDGRWARAAGSALLGGTLGGAVFVHGHGSFDFTQLSPVWLAVVAFVALPLLYGLLTPLVTDLLAGWAARLPAPLVVVVGLLVLVQPPSMLGAAIAFGIAAVVATNDALLGWWRCRFVTVAGTAVFALLVVWGCYGITVDVVSLVTGVAPTAPLNP